MGAINIEDFGYTKTTTSSVEEAAGKVQEAVKAHGFKVQHVHDVRASLAEKGFDREPYLIIEICNAKYAHVVLEKHPGIGLMMPCKINVYSINGTTYVSGMRPVLIAKLFPELDMDRIAAEVDEVVRSIVDEATSEPSPEDP